MHGTSGLITKCVSGRCDPYLLKDVGPEITTQVVPTDPATCMGPLSFVRTTSAPHTNDIITSLEKPQIDVGYRLLVLDSCENTAQTSYPASDSR